MPELGRHVDTVPEFGQCFAGQILVGQRSVDNSRVEECHAPVHRFVQQPDTLFLVRMLAAVVGQAHHSEAECRHLECRLARAQYPMASDTGSFAVIAGGFRRFRFRRENLV